MSTENRKTVLGTGLSFPYELESGRLETAEGVASVEAAMRMLFNTTIGDRFMLPEYGSKLPHLLFEPCDEQTAARAQVYVLEAIERWITRIRAASVRAEAMPEMDAIRIQVDYQLITDPSPRTFVYPFYLTVE